MEEERFHTHIVSVSSRSSTCRGEEREDRNLEGASLFGAGIGIEEERRGEKRKGKEVRARNRCEIISYLFALLVGRIG